MTVRKTTSGSANGIMTTARSRRRAGSRAARTTASASPPATSTATIAIGSTTLPTTARQKSPSATSRRKLATLGKAPVSVSVNDSFTA